MEADCHRIINPLAVTKVLFKEGFSGVRKVGQGTEERVAAINIYVENIAYSEIIDAVTQAEVLSQSNLTIDGLPAQRIERATIEDVFIPEGTEITSYFVDLEADDRTLIADTIDLTFIDYSSAKDVLDLMMETIEITES